MSELIDSIDIDNFIDDDDFLGETYELLLTDDDIFNIINFYLSNSCDKYCFDNVYQTVSHPKWTNLLKLYIKNMNEKIFFSENNVYNFICLEYDQYLQYVNALIEKNSEVNRIYTSFNIKYNLFNFIRIFKKIYNIF